MSNETKSFALTTIDNPFDPFNEFDNWLSFDIAKGYNSCQWLARIAKTSDSFSDEDQEAEIERAIDTVIQLNPGVGYKKVTRTY